MIVVNLEAFAKRIWFDTNTVEHDFNGHEVNGIHEVNGKSATTELFIL